MTNDLRLGVNIDHVATLRNARGGVSPDPVRAALMAQAAGADGITAHLREDRRSHTPSATTFGRNHRRRGVGGLRNGSVWLCNRRV